MNHALGVVSKNYCHTPFHLGFLLCYLLLISLFCVLCLGLWSILINFWKHKVCPESFLPFCLWMSSFISIICWNILFSTVLLFVSLLKMSWVYLYRSISGFSILLINQFVYSLSIAYCLDYNSFIRLEVNSVNLPTLSITFNTELAIFDHLPSHINFRISMSIFTKIICWCFKSACIVSVDVVGNSWHLDNIDLPIYKHGLSLHLFNSSLDLLSEFCSIPHIDLIHILLDLYLSFF